MPKLGNLTATNVAKATKPGDYSFSNVTGLELRVGRPNRNRQISKSWRWVGRVKALGEGKSPKVTMPIGIYGEGVGLVSLEEAEAAAVRYRGMARDGISPKDVAIEEADARRAVKEAKALEEARRVTVADLWDFYRQPGGTLSTLSERAEKEAESVWRNHVAPTFAERIASTVRKQDVRTWYRDSKRGRSANQHLSLLSNLMQEGMARDIFQDNPCSAARAKAIKGHKARKAMQSPKVRKATPSPEQFTQIVDKAYAKRPLYGLLVELAGATGLRQSPTLKCRWEWLRAPQGDSLANITVPARFMKSGKDHTLHLPADLWNKLEAWRGRDGRERVTGYVFPSPLGNSRDHVGKPKRWWRSVLADVGLEDADWHSLRRYAATQWARAGVSVHVVKELLDHSDVSTTLIYFDEPTDDEKRSAAEALAATTAAARASRPTSATVVPLHPPAAS